ncbi:DnaA regulatory inactivator Hda [Salinisphaera sp. P385]|uniref:DnaA regulatory inactivator Hda n=1 Tax=Spectribacter acetivorans TaxID=3075603 RepID=A0ABU3BDI9_9GAMM|nr:DnaA regulatory inactivator Hda [Salinisphaera sp. P385]MDT0619393.1 DnaA regulatory inactivator Hda [Salinisphaera sp. P385]
MKAEPATPLLSAQLPLGVQLPDTATLAGFAPGPNAAALAAARQAAIGPDQRGYFCGGPGKTHLLQAACRAAGEAGRRATFLPLADWCEQPPAILDGLTGLDLVCLDEVDAVAGNRAWEEALVGALDGWRAAGASVLAAGPAAPAQLTDLLADLRSRLGWGAVYALQEPADDDKRWVLVARAASRGLTLPDEVARYLLTHTSRDLRRLMPLLARLDRASLAAQRRLTIPFVKQVCLS